MQLSLAGALRSGRRGRGFKSCHPDLNHVQLAQVDWGELFSFGSQQLACLAPSAAQVQSTIEIAPLTPVFNARFLN